LELTVVLYLVETEMLLQAKVIPSSTYQHMVPYVVRIILEGKATMASS
jgi:hypothetical protein